jgi:hypothetical protein
MAHVPKSAKAGSAERIFDRLTVLALSQELLLNGAYGPLTEQQKVVLNTLLKASREAAEHLRDLVDG